MDKKSVGFMYVLQISQLVIFYGMRENEESFERKEGSTSVRERPVSFACALCQLKPPKSNHFKKRAEEVLS
jgi:hypothetical protein